MNLLESALKAKAPTIIYGVKQVQAVVDAIKQTSSTAQLLDCRGASVESAVSKALQASGPLVVLLGTEISDEARASLVDAADAQKVKLVALTSAASPTEAMGALFPMQISGDRILERAN